MDQVNTHVYPTINATLIQDPSRFFAVPLIGFLARAILLIPIFIITWALSIATWVLAIINSFFVLFTGKYWDSCYEVSMGLLNFMLKMDFYMKGLTNKYPAFSFKSEDPIYSLSMEMPKSPNRLFAIPVLGGVARFILLIPFYIYSSVVANGINLGVNLVGWAIVLFTGKYAESLFEMTRDSARLNLAAQAYMLGLSDKYPSFWISMNHKPVKIVLIIVGVLMLAYQMSMQAQSWTQFQNNLMNPATYQPGYNQNYMYNQQQLPQSPQ